VLEITSKLFIFAPLAYDPQVPLWLFVPSDYTPNNPVLKRIPQLENLKRLMASATVLRFG